MIVSFVASWGFALVLLLFAIWALVLVLILVRAALAAPHRDFCVRVRLLPHPQVEIDVRTPRSAP